MRRLFFFPRTRNFLFLWIVFAACGGCIPTTAATIPSSTPEIAPTEIGIETKAPTPTVTPTEAPGPEGWILFTSNRDGNSEIYRMAVDGSHVENLTNNPEYDGSPNWSPDGSRIVFESNRDGNTEIYVMESDGSNPVRLTDDPVMDSEPVWSPDGTRIAFLSPRVGNGVHPALYLMDPDGSNVVRLTDDTLFYCTPAWSPDGKRVAVCSGEYEPPNIAVVDVDGFSLLRLTNNEEYLEPPFNLDPVWSRDGRRIVFRSNRDDIHPIQCDSREGGCNFELYAVESDGANEIRLTSTPGDEREPAWSPDGMHLAYCAPRGGEADIYVIDVDTLEVANLTDSAGNDCGPAWSPDGRRIAFYSKRDGNAKIYVMNADGTDVVRLTNDPAEDYDPVWQPQA